MTKFQAYCKKLLEDLDTSASVFGASGDSYAPGDARIPNIFPVIQKRIPSPKKRRKPKHKYQK